jgi:hypothetical protein
VIRGGYSPVIARLGVAWKDPAYKAARRAGAAIARLAPTGGPVTVPPATARPARRLAAVPDLDAEADGDGDGTAFPWS